MIRNQACFTVVTALWCAAIALASPVPGDKYPTEGLTFSGFTFSVNVTAYANTTLDVKDMSALLDAGDFAGAAAIYEAGKNSWRNQLTTPQVMRVPKLVIARNYGTEAFYTLASSYYSQQANRYLDGPISDALAGAGDFAADQPLAPYRAAAAKAWILFYPVLYYYHEIDGGSRTNLASLRAETDDAAGCYLAPSVITKGRVAPGFNAWDVSAAVAQYFCTTTRNEVENVMTSKVNIAWRQNSIAIQQLIDAAIADNSTLHAARFTELRMGQQRLLNINQIQLVLVSAWKAAMAPLCPKAARAAGAQAATGPCEPANLAAEAWAHWRLVEPVLNSMGVARERLVAIREVLHPVAWRNRAEKRNWLSIQYGRAEHLIRDAATKAGYDFSRELVACMP